MTTQSELVPPQGYESMVEYLLHTMHDASKFADGATRAILEGVLHYCNYGTREGPHRGNKCLCPHCRCERMES